MQKAQPGNTQFVNPAPEPFNRPPRILASPPQGTIDIPAPPKKQALPPRPDFLMLLMPVIMVGMMFALYILVLHAAMQQMVFLLPMALFSIMGPGVNLISSFRNTRAARNKNRELDRKYRRALAKLRNQLTQSAEEQRRIALLANPDPLSLEGYVRERAHLWERRPEDPDFLAVRVGTGKRPFSITVQLPQLDVTDRMAGEVMRFGAEFRDIPDMPGTIALPKVKSLGITGIRQEVAALTRGMICQIATLHSPEDVRIMGIYPASQRQDWDWLRGLPHTAPLKGCKQERLTAVGEEEANALLSFLLEELSQRATKIAEANASNNGAPQPQESAALPHIVVIVHDYVEVRKHPALTHAFKLGEQLGVSIIYMVAQLQAIPSECRGMVRLAEDNKLTYAAAGFAGDVLENVNADTFALEHAMKVAHDLSGIEVAKEDDEAADLPTNVRFLDLVDLSYADQYNPEQWWAQPRYGMLRVPIGMGVNGPVWIDLNDNMHGPHGIIAGTTGAGKSELLQSLIVGLAITHHPHLVNFVLVDFKGGAAFKPFEKIPHTVGMVTDLSGKLTERALVALKSELKRREHMLSHANAKKISEYIYMRTQDPTMEPMPHLFIVIDEFAELAKEHPTFMEGLVSVVQKGRSLGVHLILATQKPTGSVNPSIWSNLKFRICLRVASLADSRDMLGRSEAALLPSTIPGRAYFQIGSEVFDLFQSARISLPARVANEAALAARQSNLNASEIIDQKVLMDIIEPYSETLGEQLFKPWPAPLPHRVSLPEVYTQAKRQAPTMQPGQPPYGWLTCPVGLMDLPAEQRQEPWLLDMPRSGGHVLIAGASGTGKSVFLRTLIASLARTHSPSQLHLYMVDFGGQALRVFEKLPHVGGIFNEADDDYIRRLLRKLDGIIEERKQFCTTNQIDDFLAYQRRRQEKADLPEMPAVVLVIDRFIEFKQVHEKEMETLLSIARYGRTYGVYLVLTVDRPVSVPMQLMSLIELRIGLRLVELTDSLILLGKHDAGHIDPNLPGRGYKRGKSIDEIHIALPVAGEDDDEQAMRLDEMSRSYAQMCKLPKTHLAQPIRLLPEYVRADYFLMDTFVGGQGGQAKTQTAGQGCEQALALRLGIEDASLRPTTLELNSDTPHALVAGTAGSGRTGVLQTLLFMLASPEYRHAQVVLVDFRRTSRLLRRLPNVWQYADTQERLASAVDALKAELQVRLVQLHEELERIPDDSDEVPGKGLAPIVLVIDDYEQITALARNPLNDLKDFLLQARNLHLHVIVAGQPADLMRGDALLTQVKGCRQGVVLAGDPSDSPVLGVRMGEMLPGRSNLVRRNQRSLVQVAHLAPDTILPWVNRLTHSVPRPPMKGLEGPYEEAQQVQALPKLSVERAASVVDTAAAGSVPVLS